MIPKCITQDLRSGLSLEDTLIKHGTNLKELFQSNSDKKCFFIDDWTYIRPTKYNSFRVAKTIYGGRIEFGTYKTHEDALLVRNELIKCNWDKNQLEDIYEKTGVMPNKVGGFRL